ncbi:hypothetical protein DMB44_03665 [Thermoplasma sp. Kam2015]|uniref:hypothetical protein n=1 Tax=Thermoplasma sp. Kam2015 TaxID=2094122 RepID=UPI000D88FA90|nr:hypothetical protein [Thermoplasma sp. Kam2015]PYB68450.1 hypothetical protein DMB44_03665 [Thermoplasma sp. Kam2015]
MPINDYNGSPSYIIDDPYSIWFYNTSISPGSYINFIGYSNTKLGNSYGIMYEADGIAALEKNYTENPVYFIPYTLNTTTNAYIRFIPPGLYLINMHFNGTFSIIADQGIIKPVNINGTFMFYANVFLSNVHFSSKMYGYVSIVEIKPTLNDE